MPVIKPGTDVKPDPNLMSIFLAGSIEMGKARGWQKEVGSKLCPKGYWRRLNVELTCGVYGVIIREDLDEVVDQIIKEMV